MNKVITLEILQNLETYLNNNLNTEIQNYNTEHDTNLQEIRNITYKNITNNLPEVFFQIEKTNFEYDDITSNLNTKIINNVYLSFAYKDNKQGWQDDIERYIFIFYKLLVSFTSDNILSFIVRDVERGELQSKDIQTLKVILFNFDIISII